MRRKRSIHNNHLPVICIGVSALLFILALGLLLGRCSCPARAQPNGCALPLAGWQRVEETTFLDVFEAMGRRAVVVAE